MVTVCLFLRFRTILDVNIDAFEEKKWKNPAVDTSDFFNFGFNEESWKQYCISLVNYCTIMFHLVKKVYFNIHVCLCSTTPVNFLATF